MPSAHPAVLSQVRANIPFAKVFGSYKTYNTIAYNGEAWQADFDIDNAVFQPPDPDRTVLRHYTREKLITTSLFSA